MTDYFVDDGGDGSDGLTWTKAYSSINALDTAVALASGDIVYFGHDHNCQAVNSAALTITGPASGLPVIFISATQGSDPPTYQVGTGTQIDTTEGATFDVTFDGSFALYGLLIKSGRSITYGSDGNESFLTNNCTSAIGSAGAVTVAGATGMVNHHHNMVIDLTQDGTTPTSATVINATSAALAKFEGLTFVNAGYRTGVIVSSATGIVSIAGADFSGFTNATPCEFANTTTMSATFTNCKTGATFALVGAQSVAGAVVMATNVGATDNPAGLAYHTYFGNAVSSTSIYRSGGATIEGIANSWLVTTTAECNEYAPFHSPWMPSRVATAGTKNFDVFISNDTADFLDSEVWIELERRTTVGSPLWTLASDQRATITTTPVNQDDDTTSTWVGPGPAFTFKQRLRITAAVEPGQYRVRVVTGVASIASSRNFYVDPDVTVT